MELREVSAGRDEHALLEDSVMLTTVDKAVGWARKFSLFPYPFATACCAMEFMSLSMSPYDIASARSCRASRRARRIC
jgi:NADH:ubiquinone oxidoreductase subunit B-like Fe-S oxidoreductase